ncbi:MAG: tetratricopeptide repeat protein [Candidatus Thorarchaeota archaeon]
MTDEDLTIKNLFSIEEKLTFLVGMDLSIDDPSNLPNKQMMMEAIINYYCAESEKEKILQIKDLKFEQLLEIIQCNLDDKLKIIDYFGLCDKPNLQHFFLADMVKKGHFLMTTNFDSLIEYALLKSNVPPKRLIPVITKDDFKIYYNPVQLAKKGLKLIYKIYGSARNVISGKDTRDSVVKMISNSILSNRGNYELYIEPFKHKIYENISNGRTIVVMGYSSSNYSNILNILKILKNVQKIIWINHSELIQFGKENLYEINSNNVQSVNKLNENLIEIGNKLLELQRMSNFSKIFLIDINTKNMVKKLLQFKPKLSSEKFAITPMEWFKNHIKSPKMIEKLLISAHIYYDFHLFNDAIRCIELMHRFLTFKEIKFWKSFAQNAIAKSYRYQQKNLGPLKQNNTQYNLNINSEDLSIRAISLNLIAKINQAQENYPEALKKFEESLKINDKLGNLKRKAICLKNIANIYQKQGKYLEALKRLKKALRINEQLEDLNRRASNFRSIGDIFKIMGDYPKALKSYLSGLRINRQLGDLTGKATCLRNVAEILMIQENYPKALKCNLAALKIYERLRNLSGEIKSLSNIASIKYEQGDFLEALNNHKKALELYEKKSVLNGKITSLDNIASILDNQVKTLEVLKGSKETISNDKNNALSELQRVKDTKKKVESFPLSHLKNNINNWEMLKEKIYNQLKISKSPVSIVYRKKIKARMDSVDRIMKKFILKD